MDPVNVLFLGHIAIPVFILLATLVLGIFADFISDKIDEKYENETC